MSRIFVQTVFLSLLFSKIIDVHTFSVLASDAARSVATVYYVARNLTSTKPCPAAAKRYTVKQKYIPSAFISTHILFPYKAFLFSTYISVLPATSRRLPS